MKKMLKRRSGFTLVELLIVIIIIGILAGAMLMLVGSGTDRAEATKIISDLRSLKAAALMYYADGNDTLAAGNQIEELKSYMDKDLDSTATDGYTFTVGDDPGQWFVGRLLVDQTGVRDALEAANEKTGLLAAPISADITTNLYTAGAAANNVYMRAR